MRNYSPFFFLLLITTTTASRFLWPPRPGLEATGLQQVKHAGDELEEEDSRWENLIEMEKCEDGNEECLERRVSLYEVHLDYIYTQHAPP